MGPVPAVGYFRGGALLCAGCANLADSVGLLEPNGRCERCNRPIWIWSGDLATLAALRDELNRGGLLPAGVDARLATPRSLVIDVPSSEDPTELEIVPCGAAFALRRTGPRPAPPMEAMTGLTDPAFLEGLGWLIGRCRYSSEVPRNGATDRHQGTNGHDDTGG